MRQRSKRGVSQWRREPWSWSPLTASFDTWYSLIFKTRVCLKICSNYPKHPQSLIVDYFSRQNDYFIDFIWLFQVSPILRPQVASTDMARSLRDASFWEQRFQVKNRETAVDLWLFVASWLGSRLWNSLKWRVMAVTILPLVFFIGNPYRVDLSTRTLSHAIRLYKWAQRVPN